jgi:hypothetical protein
MVIDINEQVSNLAWICLREATEKNAKICDVIEAYCSSTPLREKVLNKTEELIIKIKEKGKCSKVFAK